jgi:hypothetical protein
VRGDPHREHDELGNHRGRGDNEIRHGGNPLLRPITVVVDEPLGQLAEGGGGPAAASAAVGPEERVRVVAGGGNGEASLEVVATAGRRPSTSAAVERQDREHGARGGRRRQPRPAHAMTSAMARAAEELEPHRRDQLGPGALRAVLAVVGVTSSAAGAVERRRWR